MNKTHKRQQQQLQQAQQGKDKKGLSIRMESIDACQHYTEQSFPLHAKLFEKHRLRSIKRIMTTAIRAELKYHCKAIEELTAALNALSEVETDN